MIEKPEELFVGVVAQKVIIEQAGKVLLVRSKANEGKWDLPGGRLHINEQPAEGVQREVKEEISCDCTVGEVVYIGQFYHGVAKTPCVFITYKATLPDGSLIKIPDDELEAFVWLSIEECTPEVVYKNCCVAISSYIKKKT